jgi:hypothetical protein
VISNDEVADRLVEVAHLLEQQEANPFRVRAYQNAAGELRALTVPVAGILEEEGEAGLERIPHIGPALARAIRDIVVTGRLPLLERLRGTADPLALLASIPGLGPTLAERVHEALGIGTLEELEVAAHNGRLAEVPGFGPRRVAAIRAVLASRLARGIRGPPAPGGASSVAELLDVDREYREKSAAGRLPLIAPRRFNPGRRAWLPILHAARGPRHYTALYSNTALAHRVGRTHDWVVIYGDGDRGEHQATVVTAHGGRLAGLRVVRGREQECLDFYRPTERN